MITDIVFARHVQLDLKANNWEEAIKLSAKPLLSDGVINENYVAAMISSVKKHGPYIVISENVAMPHARHEDGSNGIGLCISVLKNPISFGHEENDPVKYIFCLCSVDDNSHLELMSEVATLLMDRNFFNTLNSASDAEEVIDFLNEYNF